MYIYFIYKIRKNILFINYKWFIYVINGYFIYVVEGKFQRFQDSQVGRKCYIIGRLIGSLFGDF